MESSRAEARRHFDESVRIALLEGDVDSIERTGERMSTAINRLMFAVIGAGGSLLVASLLLAADIARGR